MGALQRFCTHQHAQSALGAQFAQVCKGLRHAVDVRLSSQSETSTKKFLYWINFIKSITLRLVCRFPQFPLSSVLIKEARFCFRTKITLLKKVWIFSQYWIRDAVHYKVSEKVTMIKSYSMKKNIILEVAFSFNVLSTLP